MPAGESALQVQQRKSTPEHFFNQGGGGCHVERHRDSQPASWVDRAVEVRRRKMAQRLKARCSRVVDRVQQQEDEHTGADDLRPTLVAGWASKPAIYPPQSVRT